MSGQRTVRGIPITSAYAYNAGQGGTPSGRDHAILTAPLDAGRFHRRTGDALCKPSNKFMGLAARDIERRPPTCSECNREMERLGP